MNSFLFFTPLSNNLQSNRSQFIVIEYANFLSLLAVLFQATIISGLNYLKIMPPNCSPTFSLNSSKQAVILQPEY